MVSILRAIGGDITSVKYGAIKKKKSALGN